MTEPAIIEGQLNATERRILSEGITKAKKKPDAPVGSGN